MSHSTKNIRLDQQSAAGWKPPQQETWPHDRVFIDGTTAWLRDQGKITVPVALPGQRLKIVGNFLDYSKEFPTAFPFPLLSVKLNGQELGVIRPVQTGPLIGDFLLPPGGLPLNAVISLELQGVYWSNWLALIGRWLESIHLPGKLHRRLQEYRLQKRNRQLQLESIHVDAEEILHFRNGSLSPAGHLLNSSWTPGLNIVGHFRAALGVAEMARCMVRAADAVNLPTALVELKCKCLNSQNDESFTARLQQKNPYPINVFHLDAPQSEVIDDFHGQAFRRGHYNVAYWAWELMEFPDNRVRYHRWFDEIWCLSDFTRTAIAAKVPKPVLTMPLAIDFPVPQGEFRKQFNLPENKFLFLFIYDFHSTQARKNPQAVISAFRRAFPNDKSAGLVIKTQNGGMNPAEFSALQAELASLSTAYLINDTLPRQKILELQQACDCFVSLHRAEGFGLGLAEAMFLGKPVISTDWSATTEFVNAANGCPVQFKLVPLEHDYGPYTRGQIWAEADTEHAAHYMRKLVADDNLRSRLGAQAAADIRRLFSPESIGRRYLKRLDSFNHW